MEDFLIQNPSDATSKSLNNQIDGVQPVAVPYPTNTPVQQNTEISDDLFKSIFNNAIKKSQSVVDPYASKFQDASLTSRYEGKNVFYGDVELDSKLLDARYSKTQSYGEQSFNSLKVGLANGGAMFASGMIGLPDMLWNIAHGKPIAQSENEKALFDWSRKVSDNNITFENEQDQKTDAWNTIKNVLLPSGLSGSSKGWGSIFENVMYGVGAGASIALQEAAVSFVAPGIGNSAVLATNAAKILNNLNSLRKYGTLANRILDTSIALNSSKNALILGNKILDAAKWGYRGTIGAYGEAAFEGLEGEASYIKTATEKFQRENGYAPTGDDLKNITGVAEEVKKARFWSNMALLMGSNTYQMKRLFRNFDIARESSEQLGKQGLKVVVDKTGVSAAKGFQLKSDWWNNGFQKNLKPVVEKIGSTLNNDFAKESLSEGLEEFTQGWIDKSVNSYYTWKLDHRGQPALDQAIKSISEGFSESWNTEGLKNFISGAIAGVAQQAAFGVGGIAISGGKSLSIGKQRELELNKTLQDYNNFNINDFVSATNINSVRGTSFEKVQNLNANGVIDDVTEVAVDKGDKKIYKDLETLSFFTLAEPYVSKGHADILKQQFAFSLEEMTDEQVSGMFGVGITKQDALNEFNQQVDEVNQSYSSIKQAFKNPYNYNTDPVGYSNFETAFIPELAYLDHRSKNLNKRKNDIQDTLGEYYNEFKYFADEKSLSTGRQYINDQISEIKDTVPYKKALANIDANFRDEYVKELHLINSYNESLKALDKYESSPNIENYNEFLNEYYNAFSVKLEDVNIAGTAFIKKEEVMNKLTDFNRINNDLNTIESKLRAYLSNDGEQIFAASFSTYANSEQRKREVFQLTEEFKNLRSDIIDKTPELTPDEIDDVLTSSKNKQEVEKKIEDKVKKITEQNIKNEEIKTQIREKFINANKGDVVEDYISSITEFNDATLEKATEYIKYLNNQDFIEFKESKKQEFLKSLKSINSNLTEDNIDEVYNTLTNGDKIKYHQAVIDYRTKLKGYNNLPEIYSKKQDEIISNSKNNILELQKTPKEFINQTIGDYNILEDGNGFNVSLNGNFVNTFKQLDEAQNYINNEINNSQLQDDANYEEINNLENKFENGYFNPQWFDSEGNKIIDPEILEKNKLDEQNKIALFNYEFNGLSEDEISQRISDNLIIERFSVDEKDGFTKINKPKDTSGQLVQEPILRSVTNDAIVVKYDWSGIIVPLNTYKNYNNDLEFVKNLSENLSKDHYDKGGKLFATGFKNEMKDIRAALSRSGQGEGGQMLLTLVDNTKYATTRLSIIGNTMQVGTSGDIVDMNLISKIENPDGSVTYQSNLNRIISFIQNKNYTQFLTASTIDNSVYKLLQANGFIKFKGTPQEQLNLLNQKNKIFDYLNNKELEDIKRNVKFDRVFTSINSEKAVETPIDKITYSYAQLNDSGVNYNKQVFFRVTEKLTPKNIKEENIELVGVESEFKDEAIKKILESFSKKFNETTEVFDSYYMLISDSSGNHSTQRLVNKKLDASSWFANSKQGNDFSTVQVSANNGFTTFDISKTDDGVLITVKNGEIVTSFDSKLNNIKDVENLIPSILSHINNRKDINTKSLGLSLTSKTANKPTTREEIIESRNVVGINPNNFRVHKITASFINDVAEIVEEPSITIVPQVIPETVVSSNVTGSKATADSLGIQLPNTITYAEIDQKITNLQLIPVVLTIIKTRSDINATKGLSTYLNDEMRLSVLEPMVGQSVSVIQNTFSDKPKIGYGDFANITTTRSTPKTNIQDQSIEQRVQELIKNCVK